MKKITFVRRQYNPYGGAERYFQRLIEAMRERNRYEVQIWHIEQPRWMASWIKMLYYNFQVCSRKKNEFLFSNDRLTCLDIHRAGGGAHKAFLKTKGFTLNPLHPVYLWLEKRTLQNAKTIIANSMKVKKDILDSYDIDPEKIKVIYNGVPIRPFDKESAKRQLCQEFGIPQETKILLYVGSGFERKGVKELLDLFKEIGPDFRAFVVGKEKRIERYEAIAAAHGLDKKLFFTGPRKDVETFYAAADLFLFPTRYEPFSNVVLEALSYENVVFTTAQNGASEILEERYVMKTPDDKSVLPLIERLLTDEEALKKAQKKAGELAKNYSIEKNVEKTIEVIEETLKL